MAGRTEIAKIHALSKFLFQSFHGRLDRAALLKQVHSLDGLNRIGAVLGLEALVPPAQPGRA